MTGDTPLNTLSQCYARLLATCDALEAVADILPSPLPPESCRNLAKATTTLIAETHELEERVLMPILINSPRRELHLIAERLRQEHEFDNQAAIEVEEALISLASGNPSLSADAIGYLLRSFFESLRRHVHAEQDLLMLITDHTTPARCLH